MVRNTSETYSNRQVSFRETSIFTQFFALFKLQISHSMVQLILHESFFYFFASFKMFKIWKEMIKKVNWALKTIALRHLRLLRIRFQKCVIWSTHILNQQCLQVAKCDEVRSCSSMGPEPIPLTNLLVIIWTADSNERSSGPFLKEKSFPGDTYRNMSWHYAISSLQLQQ